MLHAFLAEQREQIIARVRDRMTKRRVPLATEQERETGIPLFLDQLGAALDRKTASSASVAEAGQALTDSAAQNAARLIVEGFTVSQVVHGYGDVCQIVTGLLIELDVPVSTEDFRTLNLCLDEAIAGAVTEFGRLREESITEAATERLALLAHELRSLLGSAHMAYGMLRDGTVPIRGSTGAVLGRSLSRLQSLADRSLAELRLEAGLHEHERIAVAELLEEMAVIETTQAKERGVQLQIRLCVPRPAVLGDRHLLGWAIDNLVQNAIKFTPCDGRVTVTLLTETTGHVVVDVADECGGLPVGDAERLFAPLEQRSMHRDGHGLSLALARKGVRTMGGDITVRDIPGMGCVFSIRLPMQ